MAKIIDTKIVENTAVAENIYRLIVSGDLQAKPGQFVQVQIPSGEFTLRRPLGIAGINGAEIKMFYRAAGHGTQFLTTLKIGDKLNLLAPLGNGFNIDNAKKYLLIGGGIGLAPLLFVEKNLHNVKTLMGGKTAAEVNFWLNEFNEPIIATDDGSKGTKGFVTDLLPEILAAEKYDEILTCGPDIMMRKIAAIAKSHNIACQVSLERRMACGLGACLSCSIDTINGRRKVCKNGPVFDAVEVYFDE